MFSANDVSQFEYMMLLLDYRIMSEGLTENNLHPSIDETMYAVSCGYLWLDRHLLSGEKSSQVSHV